MELLIVTGIFFTVFFTVHYCVRKRARRSRFLDRTWRRNELRSKIDAANRGDL